MLGVCGLSQENVGEAVNPAGGAWYLRGSFPKEAMPELEC